MKNSFPGEQPYISVFIPAYNEEGNIETVVSRCRDFLASLGKPFEIIVIDDGSDDGTGAIADQLALDDSRIKVVHHPFNIGYGGAQKSGFRYAQGKLVALIPGDNQFDPASLSGYLALADDCDIVVGWRKKREDAVSRKIFSRAFNFSMRRLFGINLRDINCVKLIHRRVIDAVTIESRGAFVDAEIMIKAKRLGARFIEIPVLHFPRTSGKEKGAGTLVILTTFFELARLWWKLACGKFKRHTGGETL